MSIFAYQIFLLLISNIMKVVIQRVTNASVSVKGEVVSSIGKKMIVNKPFLRYSHVLKTIITIKNPPAAQ